MGRTPLFRLLQRAAAIARASRHVRLPLDEFHDLVRAQRIDRRRRRLLQSAVKKSDWDMELKLPGAEPAEPGERAARTLN